MADYICTYRTNYFRVTDEEKYQKLINKLAGEDLEIFDDEKSYELWAYNIETVMAEKVETILRRGVFNTRPRDFYDAYILATTQKFDKAVFAEALNATATHRGTARQIADVPAILRNIESSRELNSMWEKYRKQFAYAAHIEYSQIMDVLKMLVG